MRKIDLRCHREDRITLPPCPDNLALIGPPPVMYTEAQDGVTEWLGRVLRNHPYAGSNPAPVSDYAGIIPSAKHPARFGVRLAVRAAGLLCGRPTRWAFRHLRTPLGGWGKTPQLAGYQHV